jgi:ABC-2 type transport system ATP-binding protein
MEPILEVNNLKKDFQDFSLKGISFSLQRGYIMGFIGPNGAGKSTTIKLILNLLKRDDGEIKVFGLDNLQNEKEIKNRIGFVLSENNFYDELTVAETRRIIAPIYRDWDQNVFQQYLSDFALPANKKVGELSGGMKMKLSLAFALSHHAELLILDEPTSGLDPIVRSELLEILSTIIQDEQKSVFFSTHITSDLDKNADYITFINDGELVLSSPKDDLLENYGLVRGAKELLTDEARDYFIGVKENKFGFEGLVEDKHFAEEFFGGRVVIEKPGLEEIMIYFTRGNGCA